jgi:hypothetical protein
MKLLETFITFVETYYDSGIRLLAYYFCLCTKNTYDIYVHRKYAEVKLTEALPTFCRTGLLFVTFLSDLSSDQLFFCSGQLISVPIFYWSDELIFVVQIMGERPSPINSDLIRECEKYEEAHQVTLHVSTKPNES